MLGNVYEWTCSEYKESYDGREQECAVSASKYSLRGGSWVDGPGEARAAFRDIVLQYNRDYGLGFRLAQD